MAILFVHIECIVNTHQDELTLINKPLLEHLSLDSRQKVLVFSDEDIIDRFWFGPHNLYNHFHWFICPKVGNLEGPRQYYEFLVQTRDVFQTLTGSEVKILDTDAHRLLLAHKAGFDPFFYNQDGVSILNYRLGMHERRS